MMANSLSKQKTLIFSFFGIAFGLCIGTVFKNYKALEIVGHCKIKPNIVKSALDVIGLNPEDSIINSQKNFVFVGVMTAKNFIDDRAKAVYNTWGKDVPGRIAFFSSEGSVSHDIPVIALQNVDDRYPPQKKSFMMLYYMYEYFIDKFEWFIRADDDVFIEVSNLEKFLRSIDSSKPQFIGQAGRGNSEEFGLLSLEFDENFCMGGPGVIFSRETLRRVAPHIPTCLRNLYSAHEDVEIGRCVQKFAGIPCTWNYEMQYIMKHNSSGRNAFIGKIARKDVYNAISLHPVKQAPLMFRLHSYLQGLKAEELRQESLFLHRDVLKMTNLLSLPNEEKVYLVPGVLLFTDKRPHSDEYFEDHKVLGINPELNKFVPRDTESILNWEFLAKSLYSCENANPKRKIDSATRESLEEIIFEVMEHINNYSQQRGRIIEFRELLYSYTRMNPVHGHDLILDLLLIYKKYRGRKMTVPVRRHLYIQRAFTSIFVKEYDENFFNFSTQHGFDNPELPQKLKKVLTGIEKISIPFSLLNHQKANEFNSRIAFVLPIMNRLRSYGNFVKNYERVAINSDKNCLFLVVLFGTNDTLKDHIQILINLKIKYPREPIHYILINKGFSRGLGLDKAVRSSFIKNNDIIFFVDVDISFEQQTLDRIRINTIERSQIYLPIVFSQYDKNRNTIVMQKCNENVSSQGGFFRQFGFGICSIYKSDIMNGEINGFDININGWGLEDVKFVEKIISVSNKQIFTLENSATPTSNFLIADKTNRSKLNVFRSPDPSLIHIFHEIECDVNLDAVQYIMCLGTKSNILGSTSLIEQIFFNYTTNESFNKSLDTERKI